MLHAEQLFSRPFRNSLTSSRCSLRNTLAVCRIGRSGVSRDSIMERSSATSVSPVRDEKSVARAVGSARTLCCVP